MTAQSSPDLATARAAAEMLAIKVKRLVQQATEFTEKQRPALPAFRELWERADLEEYIGRLEEAVKAPAVFQSRELLKQIGIAADRIPSEALEDTSKVRELLNQTERIRPFDSAAKPLVAGWLMDANIGVDQAVRSLASVEMDVLERIQATSLRKDMKARFLSDALAGSSAALTRAERLAATLDQLRDYKISMSSRIESVEAFETAATQALAEIRDLEEVHSAPPGELMALVKGKPLADAVDLLTAKHQAAASAFTNLLIAWQARANLLESLGESPGDEPRTLVGLRDGIQRLQQACEAKIGSAGIQLLEFLSAGAPFPGGLSLEEVRQGLIQLQPLITLQRSP